MLYPVPSASSFVSLRSSKQVWMGRMRQSRSSVFIVLFICCYCWRWPLEVDGSHVGENLADFAWNLIGAISRIRRGHDDALDREDQSAPSALLDDPRFLYTTLYRDDDGDEKSSDEEGERSATSDPVTSRSHGNAFPLLRVWDILEIEHRLRHLRKAGRRSVIDGHGTIDESSASVAAAAAAAAPSATEKMGGAMQGGERGGCNMADNRDDSSAGRSPSSACPSSIQRSSRQVAEEDLEPYVPYLGYIFYSFPVFSFTLPFGGQLKLFGYDFI